MLPDLSFVTNNVASSVLTAAVVGVFVGGYRWFRKVDKAMDLNVVSLARISETLTDHSRRIEATEQAVALRPRTRYPRASKSKAR